MELTRQMSRRLLSGLALPAVLVLSACGATSKPSPAGTTATTAHSTPASASGGAGDAQDRAIAEAGSLRLSDFPSGWTAGPRKRESTSEQIKRQAAACLHVSPALLQEPQPNEVQSAKFRDRTISASVENSVAVAPTEATASAYLRAFHEQQAPACLSSAFQKELATDLGREAKKLPHGIGIGKLAFETIPFPAEGTARAAYRITLPITAGGVTVASYHDDAVLVQVGRAYMSMSFQDTGGGPLGSSIEERLVKTAVGRLQSALGSA